MIYSFAGKVFARMLYNEIYWDGKPSRKNRIGKSIIRDERDRPYLVILGSILILTPIIMITTINSLNVRHDQINQDLYDLKMLPEFDKNYGKDYPMYALSILAVLILKSVFDLKKALRKRQELPEPPDKLRRLYDHSYLSRTPLPSGFEWYVNTDPSQHRWTKMWDQQTFSFESWFEKDPEGIHRKKIGLGDPNGNTSVVIDFGLM